MTAPITVSSLDELYAALASATVGETILLAGGNYGRLQLMSRSGFNIDFPSNVTIASADPGNPARFSAADVRDASNLTFDGITFDYTFSPGDPVWGRPFNFTGVENLTIRNSTFDGDVAHGVSTSDDGFGFAIGLSMRGASGVSLENNEFFGFHRAMTIGQSSNLRIVGNDIHDIRSDGMNFAQVQDVVIEENHIHDFRGSPTSTDHRDMIQFWTNGTDAPSSGIVIRGNHLDIGAGDSTQSIFMRNDQVDRDLAGDEMFYRDILIENNVIINAHAHGITVGETDGLVIRSNSVLHADGGTADGLDSTVEIPRISVSGDARNVTIANNATSALAGWSGQTGWSVSNNALIQDQDAAASGYYGDVFISSSLATRDGVHSFTAIPGGLLSTLAAGAPETLSPEGVEGLSLAFFVDRATAAERIFDATYSSFDMGALPDASTFLWDFGDGAAQNGEVVSHSYATGGIYTVTLTVATPSVSTSFGNTPSGDTATMTLDVPIAGPDVISFGQGTGFVAFETGTAAAIAIAGTQDAAGLDLGAPGTAVGIARAHVTDILGVDDFMIDLSLTSDKTDSSGEVMRLHGSLIVSVENGELVLRTFAADGAQPVLKTSGANLSDMQSHDISIGLSEGQFGISVDGAILATGAGKPLSGLGAHGLTFGNPWGQTNFDGHLTALDMTANAEDYPRDPVGTTDINGVTVPTISLSIGDEPATLPTTAPIDRAETDLAQQSGTPGSANDIVNCGAGLDGAFRYDAQFETIPEHLVDRLSVVEGADGIPITTTMA